MKKGMIELFTVICALSVLLTGCRNSIFVEKATQEEYRRYSRDELKDGQVYVKDGTGFYKVFTGNRSFSSEVTSDNEIRIAWNGSEDEEHIPTLYKGEVLVYSTKNSMPENVKLERFCDAGYSFGIRGIVANKVNETDTGYNIPFTSSDLLVSNSDASNKFINYDSNNKIVFTKIAGNSIDDYPLSRIGTVTGLNKDKTYKIESYVGSHKDSLSLKADTHIFVNDSFTTIEKESITLTQNGYISIKISDDTPSGYYYIGKAGLFRYVNMKKKDVKDLNKIDYDSGLKKDLIGEMELAVSDEEEDDTETIEKVVTVGDEISIIDFTVAPEDDEAIIYGVQVKAPDGQEHKAIFMNGAYTYHNDSALPGEYSLVIKGKNLAEESIGINTNMIPKEQKDDSGSSEPVSHYSPGTSQNTETEIIYEEVPVDVNPLYNTEQSGTQPAP